MSRIDNNRSLITYQQKFYNESKFRYSNRKQHKEHISRTPLKKLLIKRLSYKRDIIHTNLFQKMALSDCIKHNNRKIFEVLIKIQG